MKKILLLSISAMFLIASCTVEKRLYRNGFNVQWQAMNGISKKDKNVEAEAPVEEMVVAKTIQTTKTSTKVAEVYNAPVQEVVAENTNDVASISEAPVVTVEKQVASTFNGMADQTIANQQKKQDVQKVAKQEMKSLKKAMKQQKSSDDVPVALLYVLCFFVPFVAVGLVTDWDLTPVLINLLLTCLCGIPGIIHAIVVVSKNA